MDKVTATTTGWTPPAPMNPNDWTYMAPAICSAPVDGTENVFVFFRAGDSTDGIDYSWAPYNATVWPGTGHCSNIRTTAAPASAAKRDGTAYLAVTHNGGIGVSKTGTPTVFTSWPAPTMIDKASSMLSPSLGMIGDRMNCFWIDSGTNEVYFSNEYATGGWNAGAPLPQCIALFAPALSELNGIHYLFYQGIDGHIYYVTASGPNSWDTTPTKLSETPAQSGPTACAGGHILSVFWQKTDGTVMNLCRYPDSDWGAGTFPADAQTITRLSASAYNDDAQNHDYIHVFWEHASKIMYASYTFIP